VLCSRAARLALPVAEKTEPLNDQMTSNPDHAFIIRLWREPGLTRADGRPLWRGQVQCVATGHTRAFQSLDRLVHFIRSESGIEIDTEIKIEGSQT
jgi:hypothetical protein